VFASLSVVVTLDRNASGVEKATAVPIGARGARFELPQRTEPKGLVGRLRGASGARERVGCREKKQIAVSCPLLELSTSGTRAAGISGMLRERWKLAHQFSIAAASGARGPILGPFRQG